MALGACAGPGAERVSYYGSIGSEAPGFAGICTDGVSRSLSDYQGRWLLLVFLRHFL